MECGARFLLNCLVGRFVRELVLTGFLGLLLVGWGLCVWMTTGICGWRWDIGYVGWNLWSRGDGIFGCFVYGIGWLL